jgi:hypothetical protein
VLAYQRPHPSPLREQTAYQIAAHMARSACDSYKFFGIALFAHRSFLTWEPSFAAAGNMSVVGIEHKSHLTPIRDS